MSHPLDDISEEVAARLSRFTRKNLEAVAQLLLDECGYLADHNPAGDDQVGRFPCSNQNWHRCSGSIFHAEWCATTPASEPGPGRGVACPKPCEEGPPAPWCHCSGFDCGTCATVRELQALVEATPA